jgi:asparagine N-glycosylation enzyme membrane subunit Stt3
MSNLCFAIFPDDSASASPSAVFADFEDAMDWATRHYPDGSCRIGRIDLVQVGRRTDDDGAGSRAS